MAESTSFADISDQPLNSELLQQLVAFCRKHNLQQTEEILAKEAQTVLRDGTLAPMNENVLADFSAFLKQVEAAYDVFQAELSLLLFPVFAHCFIKLLFEHPSPNAARLFFERFSARIPMAYEEQLVELSRVQTAEQARTNEYIQLLRTSPFVVRISKSCMTQLDPSLQRNATVRNIVKDRMAIEQSDILVKSKAAVECQMGGILGQQSSRNEKKHKMFYGVLREDSPYAEKRRLRTKESKDKKRETNAPAADRIPLPTNEIIRSERGQMAKDALSRMAYINADNPPSICLFTALNSGAGVSSCDIADDTSIFALGMGDSNISLFAVDESTKLKRLKESDELEKIDMDVEFDRVKELMYDDISASRSVTLSGHSGPVYSTNFSPCRRLLLSSAADSTVRLWSVDTFRNVVVHRLSRPVWQVQFCPRGYYFCTAGSDKTAAVWATDRVHPLRVFPDCYGHVTCVDFHPNCNYVAGGSDDRYVRVWDVLSGTCVRTMSGHKAGIRGIKVSPCGRYIVSVSGDGTICVWDVAMQRMVGMESRTIPTIMASISFTREGDTFAVSHGTSSISIYSLEGLIRSCGIQDNYTFDPKINPDGFQMFHYATKQSPVVGLHWTRRNLLLGIGSFMQ